MLTKEQIMQRLEESNALLADGFEAALIGVTENHHMQDIAVYDLDMCIDVLIAEGMTEEDAMEHMSYNVLGSFVGEMMPIFISTNFSIEENYRPTC